MLSLVCRLKDRFLLESIRKRLSTGSCLKESRNNHQCLIDFDIGWVPRILKGNIKSCWIIWDLGEIHVRKWRENSWKHWSLLPEFFKENECLSESKFNKEGLDSHASKIEVPLEPESNRKIKEGRLYSLASLNIIYSIFYKVFTLMWRSVTCYFLLRYWFWSLGRVKEWRQKSEWRVFFSLPFFLSHLSCLTVHFVET